MAKQIKLSTPANAAHLAKSIAQHKAGKAVRRDLARTLAGKGGPGRGQGRKSIAGTGASPVLRLRVSQAQKDKVKERGGVAWLRRLIDAA